MTSYLVPPQNIRSKLDDLWNSQETKYKMRASLFNLIFFMKKSPREEYIRKIASKLVEKFPARIFFISLDPSLGEGQLQTFVSVMATMQGEFAITCDLIEIRSGDKDKNKIPFLILPHIIPDLPVFLIWPENPSSEENLRKELESFVTRVIFDSESAEDLLGFAQSVLALQKTFPGELADLNWARLESWRSLINSVFSTPESLKNINALSSMTITYNAQETPSFCHTKIQSIYLQAWIASRLKWKKRGPRDPSFLSFGYQGETTPIEVKLCSVKEAKLPPGMILSLSLKTTKGEEYLFSRKTSAPHQISFEHTTPSACSIPIRLQEAKGESGQSLVKEICQRGTSGHYLAMLTEIVSEE
ncbi:MAG: hypothetical protein FJZ58_04470 [Chlamydiae bacterium]|nr:hypothetical protein [Chlamydiota bacterium]